MDEASGFEEDSKMETTEGFNTANDTSLGVTNLFGGMKVGEENGAESQTVDDDDKLDLSAPSNTQLGQELDKQLGYNNFPPLQKKTGGDILSQAVGAAGIDQEQKEAESYQEEFPPLRETGTKNKVFPNTPARKSKKKSRTLADSLSASLSDTPAKPGLIKHMETRALTRRTPKVEPGMNDTLAEVKDLGEEEEMDTIVKPE